MIARHINTILKTWLMLLFGVSLTFPALTQDTLRIANDLKAQGHFRKTLDILETYLQDHRQNVDAERIYCHTLYQMGKIDEAIRAYSSARGQFPGHPGLTRDYAAVLADLGRYREAVDLLHPLLDADHGDLETRYILATTWYWAGFPVKALGVLRVADPGFRNHAEGDALRSELLLATALHTRVGLAYLTDDQPLHIPQMTLIAGFWRNRFLHPELRVSGRVLDDSSSVIGVASALLGNGFSFPTLGLALRPSLGFYRAAENSEMLYGADVEIEIFSGLKMHLGVHHEPYPHTWSAVRHAVFLDRYEAVLDLDRGTSFLGKGAFRREVFDDGNTITTAYGWILSPEASLGPLGIRGGYAFQYADAGDNTFTSREVPDYIFSNYLPGDEIPGSYDPYFTPQDQLSHAVIASLAIGNPDKTSLQMHGSVGIYARSQHPYLYIDEGPAIGREFYRERFTPVQIEVRLLRAFSPGVSADLGYRYLKTLFYTSHLVSLDLAFKFPIHE